MSGDPEYQPGDVAIATVRGVEELNALPTGSVVREVDTGPFLGIETVPGVFEKFPNGLGWHCVAGHGDRTAEIEFPATVLHVPGTVTSRAVVVTEADRDELIGQITRTFRGVDFVALGDLLRQWFAAKLEGDR